MMLREGLRSECLGPRNPDTEEAGSCGVETMKILMNRKIIVASVN